MNYSIEQIKASVVTGAPLCAIAWGRETLRERKTEMTLPHGWGITIAATHGCGNRGSFHPVPKSREARDQYNGWRLTALTNQGLSSQQAQRCIDAVADQSYGHEVEAEAVALALRAPAAVWDPDALAVGRRREEFLARWEGVVRHANRQAGDGGITHPRQMALIRIARAILLAP